MKGLSVNPHVPKSSYRNRKSFIAADLARIALCALSLCTGGIAAADSERNAERHWDRGGVVYAMTNATSGNQILVYVRDAAGRLRHVPGATASTRGSGGSATAAVDPLGSQGSLVYDNDSAPYAELPSAYSRSRAGLYPRQRPARTGRDAQTGRRAAC
jgi:hypothetical protein